MQVRVGRRLCNWNTKPTVRARNASTFLRRARFSPLTQTSPDVGWSSAPTRFRRVLLPQPLGPMTATNSPRPMLEVRVVQRVHGALAAAVGLGQVDRPDQFLAHVMLYPDQLCVKLETRETATTSGVCHLFLHPVQLRTDSARAGSRTRSCPSAAPDRGRIPRRSACSSCCPCRSCSSWRSGSPCPERCGRAARRSVTSAGMPTARRLTSVSRRSVVSTRSLPVSPSIRSTSPGTAISPGRTFTVPTCP